MAISKKKRRQIFKAKVLKPKKEEAEFGRGHPEFFICPICKAVYYKKSWHHGFPAKLGREDKLIRFETCPACRMIQNRTFEGQVILDGVPPNRTKEALARIENVGRAAFADDVLARIIRVTHRGRRIEALTTENQLTLMIARQVQEMLRGKLDVRFSEDESVVRVYWRPQER